MAKVKNTIKRIDDPAYSYWAALYMSFYSSRLYIDIGKRWRGFGLLYLLLVIAILSIPFSFRMVSNFNETFQQQLMGPLEKLPNIYVQNGKASFDKPMPYLIKNDKNQVVIIVDTTNHVNTFTDKYPFLNILINQDKISFRMPTPEFFGLSEPHPNNREVMDQSFDKTTNLVFNGKKILDDNTVSKLKFTSQLMIYPVVVAILYSIFLVMFLVLGFLGQIFSRIFFSFQITFAQGCRLLMVAATPMLLVLMVALTTNLLFIGLGIVLMTLLTVYFSYGLFSLKSESKRMATI